MRQFALFCIAGGLAFLVDAGLVQLLAGWLDVDPYLARLLSFLAAVTTTWLFNRSITFSAAAGRGQALVVEWLRYVVSQLGGFTVNFAVYAVLVWAVPLVRQWPVLGVAAGSVAGLVVNFLLAKRYVFQRR